MNNYLNTSEEFQQVVDNFEKEFGIKLKLTDVNKVTSILEEQIIELLFAGYDKVKLPHFGSFTISKKRRIVEKVIEKGSKLGLTKEESIKQLYSHKLLQETVKQDTSPIKFNWKKTKNEIN
jgi:nucleoid DNA-binding protein